MNNWAIGFLIINTSAILLLPRRLAIFPILVGACYMTLSQMIVVGPFHFTVIRILVATGLARMIFRHERPVGWLNKLDWLIILWSVWLLFTSIFHKDPSAALIFRLGIVYNVCGTYFLVRTFCQSLEDVVRLCRLIVFLLIPVAIEMLFEKITGHNLFSLLGGVPEISSVREGRIRAQGPFAHSILAGTVGAVCLPFMVGIWTRHRKEAIIGIIASLLIVSASSSSGPIMSTIIAIGAMVIWPYRQYMSYFYWLAVFGYIGLELIMKAPAIYLITRFNVVAGSSSWHRAKLIESAFDHISEWWLYGTDYTRHWMPTGVPWHIDHTDITNHYIQLGVIGGLPLMILFIATLFKGFSFIRQKVLQMDKEANELTFLIWTIGASLFSHAITCLSVSYFDQSLIFLYLTLALIGTIQYSKTSALLDNRRILNNRILIKNV